MYQYFLGLLEEYNVRPADVVKATGLTSTVFTDWKKGKSAPKGEKLQRIADYFGVTAEYLLTGKDMLCDFNFQMPVARNIRKFREKRGMSVEELAEQLHIHPLAIIKMEQGTIVPTSNKLLEKMSDILRIPQEELWENDQVNLPKSYSDMIEMKAEQKEITENLDRIDMQEFIETIEQEFHRQSDIEKIDWYKNYLNKEILKKFFEY